MTQYPELPPPLLSSKEPLPPRPPLSSLLPLLPLPLLLDLTLSPPLPRPLSPPLSAAPPRPRRILSLRSSSPRPSLRLARSITAFLDSKTSRYLWAKDQHLISSKAASGQKKPRDSLQPHPPVLPSRMSEDEKDDCNHPPPQLSQVPMPRDYSSNHNLKSYDAFILKPQTSSHDINTRSKP